MKNSVLLASLCLGIFAPGALAANVFINGSFSEQVDASNNYFLSKSPLGYTYRSLSALNLKALAATPNTRYLLDSNYSYYKYFGPGAADTTLTWGTPASARFVVDHTTPLSKYNLAMSWRRQDLATAALAQTGTATGHGTYDTFKVDGGVTRDLSRTDSISWSAHGTKVSYSDPSQTPYADFLTTAAWTHRLNPRTTLTNSVTFDWFDANNPANSQRLFWQIMSGLQTQLSNRLSFNASVGEVFVNAYQEGLLLPPVPSSSSPFQLQVGAAHGWVANAGLNYQFSKSTKVGLFAARTVTPTIYGQLQQNESIGLSLNYDINHSSTLAFLTQFSHVTALTSSSDYFSASATYGYRLTREWRTRLTYIYSQRNDVTGSARSSTIAFGLTRDFNLMGKPPTAVQKTPSELVYEQLQRAQQALPTLSPLLSLGVPDPYM